MATGKEVNCEVYDGWWGGIEDLNEILKESLWEGVVETVDGCTVEPDGHCPHGFMSPLLEVGLI